MSSGFTLDGNGDVTAGHLQMASSAARLALGVSRLSGRLSMETRLARAASATRSIWTASRWAWMACAAVPRW